MQPVTGPVQPHERKQMATECWSRLHAPAPVYVHANPNYAAVIEALEKKKLEFETAISVLRGL